MFRQKINIQSFHNNRQTKDINKQTTDVTDRQKIFTIVV